MKATLLLIAIAVISYALGSFNGAIISSKYLFKKDVRDYGSGNAGLTNFHRTFGLAGVALVVITDMLKTVLAVLIGGWLLGIVDYSMPGKLFAGFCAVLGHSFPAFYQFRGGKGILCGGTLALMVDWRVGLILWATFAVIVIFTRYVSLGSLIVSVMLPLLLWAFRFTGLEIALGAFVAIVLIFNHRTNIVRLIGRTESKLNLGKPSKPSV